MMVDHDVVPPGTTGIQQPHHRRGGGPFHHAVAITEEEQEQENPHNDDEHDYDDDTPITTDDDEFSTTSSYHDPSENDLNMWQGAALLMADCLGTGILALPQDIQVLGRIVGLGFLIFNLPINLYAGTILSRAAHVVEERQQQENIKNENEQEKNQDTAEIVSTDRGVALVRVVHAKKTNYSSISRSAAEEEEDAAATAEAAPTPPVTTISTTTDDANDTTTATTGDDIFADEPDNDDDQLNQQQQHHHHHVHHDTATFDFIGMTQALFHRPIATRIVMSVYYTNIFLVLGNYILVMSHAVSALMGEDWMCLPLAGIIASTLMFAVSQLRTMANLGREASIISLSALAIVVVQCLIACQQRSGYSSSNEVMEQQQQQTDENTVETTNTTTTSSSSSSESKEVYSLMRQFSAIASIGFAVGSQKLFLNIRHEMKHRNEAAPGSLGISLSVFGTAYVAICILAGPNPPSFLFDAIAPGWNRHLAGLFLWIHVVVSYAINSQAICSSIDRLFFHRVTLLDLHTKDKQRWMVLTLSLAVSSYLVANAIPFFKDLVALIGALTSVPLTLLMPAIFHRRVKGVPLWKPTRDSLVSYALVVFSIVFLLLGLFGALGSIELDWSRHGGPFACH